MWQNYFNDPIFLTLTILIAFIFIISMVGFIISIINNKKLSKILKNCQTGKLDQSIADYYNRNEQIAKRLETGLKDLERLEKNMGIFVQKVGSVRYKAFTDTGSDLSFAVALLDGSDSGVVINGIFGREQSTVYLKNIVKGEAKQPLSDEEKNAIANAMENYNKNYLPKL